MNRLRPEKIEENQIKLYPSKHFLFSKTSSRRLEDVFSVTLFVFQDVFKTSSRRICNTSSWNVFKTLSRRLPRGLQDVFQDVFKTCLQDVLQLCRQLRLQDVFICHTEDVLKTSWRRLQHVFTKTNVCWNVVIMSPTSFSVNPHSIVCRNVKELSLLKSGAISEV